MAAPDARKTTVASPSAESELSLSSTRSSESYRSPLRHHQRTTSSPRPVKETHNARSTHSNSQDDGTSQLRINQYVITHEIGRGSFGAVHLATDQYGKEYAVKEFSKSRLRRRAKSNLLRRPRHLNLEAAPSSEAHPPRGFQALISKITPLTQGRGSGEEDNSFDLIKEEIAIMKKLNHTNLVALIEVLDDPEDDSLFMVLEMCKKGVIMKVELDQSADPYDEESCRCWFRDLILGIEYLHAQGVVHRDIKPDNCLLTEDDTLKIVDFGVSEMFEKQSEMRIAKAAGSPAFMAPELCRISGGNVPGRSADIWSMGVTLFCLRFGRVPFQKNAVLDLYNAIMNDPLELPLDCEPVFADLISRILEKDPSKRIKMNELREHPWVTQGGEDPLLSAEENCANPVSPPTQAEMNAAITNNMARAMAVMKAVNRFKSLIEARRPDLLHGILGRASQIVKPPLSMDTTVTKSAETVQAKDLSEKDSRELDELAEDSSRDADAPIGQVKHVINKMKHMAIQPTKSRSEANLTIPDHAEPKPGLKKMPTEPITTEGHRGHAHDPLEDHLYLSIGTGPPDQDSSLDTDDAFVISESPPGTDYNIYEQAYEHEINEIQRKRGREATVYLTRRVERFRDHLLKDDSLGGFALGPTATAAKQTFADLVDKAKALGESHGYIPTDDNKTSEQSREET